MTNKETKQIAEMVRQSRSGFSDFSGAERAQQGVDVVAANLAQLFTEIVPGFDGPGFISLCHD